MSEFYLQYQDCDWWIINYRGEGQGTECSPRFADARAFTADEVAMVKRELRHIEGGDVRVIPVADALSEAGVSDRIE